jgi:hypothetical protein
MHDEVKRRAVSPLAHDPFQAISGAAKAWVIFGRATWSKCSRPIVAPSAGTGPSEAVALLDAATAMPALSKATKAP